MHVTEKESGPRYSGHVGYIFRIRGYRTKRISPRKARRRLSAGTGSAFGGFGDMTTLTVNGRDYPLDLDDARLTLLDALRDRLGLTGTKKGCDQGACGACTVIADGRRILSCLTLAAQCDGRAITTIEGLGSESGPHPMQEAFVRHDAFQCGYCTSGQIMSAVCLLAEGRAGSDPDIREFMSGNLCRCGAYPNIVAAIREVAGAGGGDA